MVFGRVCLISQSSVDPGELEALTFHQPFEGRQTTLGDGRFDMMVAQAVDFQHDQPALPGVDVRVGLAPGQPFDQPLIEGTLVVHFQYAGQDDVDRRKDKPAHDRAQPARDLKHG